MLQYCTICCSYWLLYSTLHPAKLRRRPPAAPASESLSPACCAGARAAVARLLRQAAESPRARSAAMLCPKSLECALIFNCCCLLRRRPPGVNEARRRRAPLPGPWGGASSRSPPCLQNHRCLQRSSGHHQQHPALVRRWTAALGWLEIGVPGTKRGVEKPPSIAGFRDGSALLQPWKAT